MALESVEYCCTFRNSNWAVSQSPLNNARFPASSDWDGLWVGVGVGVEVGGGVGVEVGGAGEVDAIGGSGVLVRVQAASKLKARMKNRRDNGAISDMDEIIKDGQ